MTFEIPTHDTCPFCDYLTGIKPCAFLAQGDHVSSFLNRTQFERGAVLLVPNRHVESILDLNAGLMSALYAEAQRIARAMVRALGAVGLNMFQNNGVRAGQSVAHYHVHLVPRYATSKPWRRFHSEDFPHTPLEDLAKLAIDLRAALD